MPERQTTDRPNVVLILADDMGYGDVEFMNPESRIPTPEMNALAERGRVFTDAHANAAVCTPTRYGILTGRYCWRSRVPHGTLNGYDPPLVEPDRMNLARLLKQCGYATGYVGKWHLGLDWTTRDGEEPTDEGWNVDFAAELTGGPVDLGFDYHFGISASLNMPPYCFIEDRRVVGAPTEVKDPVRIGERPAPTAPDWSDEAVGPRLTGEALGFLERHQAKRPDTPFFLYLASQAPHQPTVPGPRFRGLSQAGPRGDMVCEFDWTVGQVVRKLEEMGKPEDTLLIVTSDNGARYGDPLEHVADDPRADGAPRRGNDVSYGHKSCGELRGQKTEIWDGGHRVPFVACWPSRVPEGSRSDEQLCLTDILATAADLLDCRLPHDAGEDSYSLLPALLGRGTREPIREATVYQSWLGMPAIRQGRWKLVTQRGSGGFTQPSFYSPEPGEPEGQLYDMGDDTAEQQNLYLERPEVVEGLRDLLTGYQESDRSAPRHT